VHRSRDHFILLALGVLVLIASGCGKSSTSPEQPTYALLGTLLVEGQPNAASALVRLFTAPQDPTLQQILSDYPAVGFSPVTALMFDPLTQTPAAVVHPDSAGHFRFEGLAMGAYIVDADLAGWGCPQPAVVLVPDVNNLGTLHLATLQLVSGSLGDVVWPTGTAYQLTGNVTVLPSSDLVIQQGVLVEVPGDFNITVYGSLRVDGVPTDPVRWRLSPEQFQSGGDWGGLRLEQPVSSCDLTGMLIQGAATSLRVVGGTVQVQECLFEAPGTFGVYFSAGAEGWVDHCVVRDGDQGLTADNSSPHFDRNVVLRMSGKGITAKTNSQAVIHGNVVMQCESGLWSDWNAAPLVEYNLFSGGSYGLDAQSGFVGTVRYNVFSSQTVQSVYLHVRNCYPLIQFNNFLNAPLTILKVDGNNGQQADTIWAPDDYWDGAAMEVIATRIIDGHDIGSPGNPISIVEYMPPRSTPVPEAGP
jgi:hypothetical protein